MKLPTLFTQQPDKINNKITPKIKRAFAISTLVANLTNGKEGLVRAATGNKMKILGVASPSNPLTNMTNHIVARYPDMMISGCVMTLVAAMCANDRQLEIAAACIARLTLEDGEPLTAVKLVSDVLPKGFPSAEYMAELEAFYDASPDLLWSPIREKVN